MAVSSAINEEVRSVQDWKVRRAIERAASAVHSSPAAVGDIIVAGKAAGVFLFP